MTEIHTPRVLHICKVFQPVKGGIQTVVYNIASLLHGCAHTVVTTGVDGAIREEVMGRVKVLRSRSYGQIASMPIAPSLVWRVMKLARKFQLIAVHYPFPLAELALLFVFRAPPIVVHWHSEVIAQRKLKWIVAPLSWLMLLRCDAIVVTSDKMLKQSRLLNRFRHKITFIPYGLESVKPSHGKPVSKGDYFLMVGRHVSYKGIEVAIRAMQNLSTRLVIAGDGPLYEQHVHLTTELGLQDKIKFERYANDAEVTNLMSYCKALVLPSVMENEAFALVQLEAMRLGKPIINTELKSSVPWVARHQSEALTVPPRDVTELAAAMQKLDDDTELAMRLGRKGLSRFNDLFTTKRFERLTDELYQNLMARK